jgi:hypothetical protein
MRRLQAKAQVFESNDHCDCLWATDVNEEISDSFPHMTLLSPRPADSACADSSFSSPSLGGFRLAATVLPALAVLPTLAAFASRPASVDWHAV